MIASVAGRVVALSAESAVIEVGGVGLAVQGTARTLAELRLGEPARLSTSLVVREDSLTLFGFADEDERTVFEQLQAASGVGPRLALAVLAVHPPRQVRAAVASEDVAALTLVPGIGKKGAQRLLLELKDKLAPYGEADSLSAAETSSPGEPAGAWRSQLRSGLAGLGWAGRDIDDAVRAVAPEAEAAQALGEQPDLAGLLRSSLLILSKA
jgi:Holliday junction DNA helicase RuvA